VLLLSVLLFIGTVLTAVSSGKGTEPAVPAPRRPTPASTTSSIWAPYWKLGNKFESTVLINNLQPQAVTLEPLVYTASCELLAGEPVSLDGLESRQVSLREIVGDLKGEGQIGFSFEGMSMDVVAQVFVSNIKQHTSFNHIMMAAMGKSSRIEGICYMPR